MSVDDGEQSSRPETRPGRGKRRRPPAKGTAGKGGAGHSRTRTGGSGDRQNRKRVPPAIRIGVAVEPSEVVDRRTQFRVLEVDAGAELLSERIVAPWVDRTPEGFVLDVRAHRLLTHHPAPMESIAPEVRDLLPPAVRARRQVYADDLSASALDLALDRFLATVRPLQEFSRLGTLVFPFPSYFLPSPQSLDYLTWLRERAGDLPLAIEFRHRDWVETKRRDETMAFLAEHRMTNVGVDVPSGFPTSLPPLAVATTDLAIVRFHGRNAAAWERGVDTGEDRMRYDYRRTDLDPWSPRLNKLAASAKAVHVLFTTGRGEDAARDARLLVRALTEEPEPPPPPPPRGKGGRPRPPHRR